MEAIHRWRLLPRAAWTGYAASLGLVALVSLIIGVVTGRVTIANISMVYLLAVLADAALFGIGPAIAASVAAFLVFDWFFIEPLHTFTVTDPAEWLQLVLFLVTAAITGGLAGGLRRRAQVAAQREREAAVLYDVVRLLGQTDISQAIQSVAERLRKELDVAAIGIELAESGQEPMRAVAGRADLLPGSLISPQASAEVLTRGVAPTGSNSAGPGRWIRVVSPHSTVSAAGQRIHRHLVPIDSQSRRVGLLMLVHLVEEPEFSPADDRLLSAVGEQLGLSIERRRLRRESTEAEILRRTDELKTALLNAVSHDLRTPLASIIASAGALLQRNVGWSEAERREFAEAIENEARRLNQLVGNLLDLSRIESGNLLVEKGWYDLSVLVDEVLGRLRPLTQEHQVSVSIPEDLPPIRLGYVEIDQVLSNLVENATKYAPAGTRIGISARREGREVWVEVSNEGPHIPPEAFSKLFDPFYRVRGAASQTRGVGLGLAVVKGLVEAHGGRIWAENRPGGGVRFTFVLPIGDTAGTAAEESGV
ncbi:MAG TPA: ATP-binding protein [Chloroflexota bacterium]